MNAGTNIKPRLQGRPGATRSHEPFVLAVVSRHHEIFKKTPFVSGLHPVSRDVVKDIPEIGIIPLLTRTLFDHNVSQGFADAGGTIAEKPTAVTSHSYQDVLRSADEQTAEGDVVGGRGTQADPMSPPVMSFGSGISNGNLTDRRWDARTSGRAAGATNAGAGLHATFARLNEFAIAGARLPGGDLEKHSYADI